MDLPLYIDKIGIIRNASFNRCLSLYDVTKIRRFCERISFVSCDFHKKTYIRLYDTAFLNRNAKNNRTAIITKQSLSWRSFHKSRELCRSLIRWNHMTELPMRFVLVVGNLIPESGMRFWGDKTITVICYICYRFIYVVEYQCNKSVDV